MSRSCTLTVPLGWGWPRLPTVTAAGFAGAGAGAGGAGAGTGGAGGSASLRRTRDSSCFAGGLDSTCLRTRGMPSAVAGAAGFGAAGFGTPRAAGATGALAALFGGSGGMTVTGGAGAVGHYAVQLARWAGARVIATVSSPDKAERALAGGAHHVINYRQDNVAEAVMAFTGGEGVHHIVDVDFGGNLEASLACLRVNGSIAYYATKGGVMPKVPAGALMRLNATFSGVYLPISPHEARRRAQADIAAWIAETPRQLAVAARFPLEDCAGAHEKVEAGDKVGTVVVEIGQD